MTQTLRLAALSLILALPAVASQPGEKEAPAPQVDAPIHHADPAHLPATADPDAPRPVPMAVMNYETFEATVDHADLPECPAALAEPGRFCRLVLHGEALHVFAFSEDNDQPLQAVMAYPVERLTLD